MDFIGIVEWLIPVVIAITAFAVVAHATRRRHKPSTSLSWRAELWRRKHRAFWDLEQAIFHLAELGLAAEELRIAEEEAASEKRQLAGAAERKAEIEHNRQAHLRWLKRMNDKARRKWFLEQMTDEERGEIWDTYTRDKLISWSGPMRMMTFDRQREYFLQNAPEICDWPLPASLIAKVERRLNVAE
jgi:hypothetical protein